MLRTFHCFHYPHWMPGLFLSAYKAPLPEATIELVRTTSCLLLRAFSELCPSQWWRRRHSPDEEESNRPLSIFSKAVTLWPQWPAATFLFPNTRSVAWSVRLFPMRRFSSPNDALLVDFSLLLSLSIVQWKHGSFSYWAVLTSSFWKLLVWVRNCLVILNLEHLCSQLAPIFVSCGNLCPLAPPSHFLISRLECYCCTSSYFFWYRYFLVRIRPWILLSAPAPPWSDFTFGSRWPTSRCCFRTSCYSHCFCLCLILTHARCLRFFLYASHIFSNFPPSGNKGVRKSARRSPGPFFMEFAGFIALPPVFPYNSEPWENFPFLRQQSPPRRLLPYIPLANFSPLQRPVSSHLVREPHCVLKINYPGFGKISISPPSLRFPLEPFSKLRPLPRYLHDNRL